MYAHVVTPVADDSGLTGSALYLHTDTHLCRLHRSEELVMQTKGERWEGMEKPVVPTPMLPCRS